MKTNKKLLLLIAAAGLCVSSIANARVAYQGQLQKSNHHTVAKVKNNQSKARVAVKIKNVKRQVRSADLFFNHRHPNRPHAAKGMIKR